MAQAGSGIKAGGISSEAVRAKTGKAWPEWFKILDAAKAPRLTHQEIVAFLHEKHGVGPWWQQMITVGYEQSRGMRQVHQTGRGFEVSVSRTLAVPVATLYAAWANEAERGKWLRRSKMRVRSAVPKKSIRIAWSGGKSDVDVRFYSKGRAKSQVTVQQSQLAGRACERMRMLWRRRSTGSRRGQPAAGHCNPDRSRGIVDKIPLRSEYWPGRPDARVKWPAVGRATWPDCHAIWLFLPDPTQSGEALPRYSYPRRREVAPWP
jgi:hypothetical protein